jgi:type I restriction enzyme S subunit
MKQVLLSDVCEINPRMDLGISDDAECSFVPMEYVDDISGTIANTSIRRVGDVKKGYTFFKNDDVIFAKITPCMENGKCAIGKNLKNGIAFGSTEYHVIRAKEEVIPEWVYYYLRQEHVRQSATHWFRGTAGQQRVPATFLEELKLPLPPLTEQKRIASLLRRADRLRTLRQAAHELGESLLQSVFLEMFGDPGINPKNWEILPISDLLSKTRNGLQTGPFGSSLKRHEYVSEGIPVWGINNLGENRFIEDDPLYITEEKFQQLQNYTVEKGDIFISRAGTVGRMCVAYPSVSPSIIGTNLVRISLDFKIINPEYFTALFSYFGSRFASLKMTDDENAYSFINPSILRTMRIPVPPLSPQEEFAGVVRRVESLRGRMSEAGRQVEGLFESLLVQSFQVSNKRKFL